MITTIASSIKTICDLLVSLLKTGAENRKTLFESHVEPVFQHLLRIHEDYASAIHEVIKLLRDYQLRPDELRDSLIDRKLKLEHVRRLVLELAQSLDLSRGDRNESIREFAQSVVLYFWSTAGGLNLGVGKTRLTGLIDLTDDLLSGDIDEEMFEVEVEEIEDDLNHAWSTVSRNYSNLRAELL